MLTPDILEALVALRTQGGSGNRLIWTMGPAWFVFSGAKGQQSIRCEAAAKAWLPNSVAMGLEQTSLLRRAGFAREGQPKLLGRNFESDAAEIVTVVQPLFESVYKQHGESLVQLYLGDAEEVENDRLMGAMRRVSKERTMDARQSVYRALLRSELLVPLQENGDMIQMGTLGDRPVYAVFSDWNALRHWDPRGHRYEKVKGSPYFLGLAQTEAGSVLINPQGLVGGELYRNEILAIAGAIRGVRGEG